MRNLFLHSPTSQWYSKLSRDSVFCCFWCIFKWHTAYCVQQTTYALLHLGLKLNIISKGDFV